MAADESQELLQNALQLPDEPTVLWAISGEWCFAARPTRPELNVWHGYPVVGSEVPERVLRAMATHGRITRHQLRRLRKQRTLPHRWGENVV
jgi:hypothetical protein